MKTGKVIDTRLRFTHPTAICATLAEAILTAETARSASGSVHSSQLSALAVELQHLTGH
jgi:hypothetical protein